MRGGLPRRVRCLAVGAVFCASTPAWPANEAVEQFKRGADLVKPYVVLSGRTEKDPHSEDGRRSLHEGIASLTRATELRPDYWQALFFLGKAYQAEADHAAAWQALKRARELQPGQVDVSREYALEALCSSHPEEALATAREAAEAHRADAELAANFGFMLMMNRQFDAAQATTEAALRLDPSDRVTSALLRRIKAVKAGGPLPDPCQH